MRISVLVDRAGTVIAAALPPQQSRYGEDEVGVLEIEPSEGQTLLELDVPDDQIPAELGPELEQTLQRLVATSGQARHSSD